MVGRRAAGSNAQPGVGVPAEDIGQRFVSPARVTPAGLGSPRRRRYEPATPTISMPVARQVSWPFRSNVPGHADERTCGTFHRRGRLGVLAVRGDAHCSWPRRPVEQDSWPAVPTWRTAQGIAG
jgi:hypothetical protein